MIFCAIILSIPSIQTSIAKSLTDSLNENYNTNISIEKVDLSFIGSINLKNITILDHHKDTLIHTSELSTSLLALNKLINKDLDFQSISLRGTKVYMKIYKEEEDSNLDVFIDSFGDSDSDSEPFLLSTKNLYIENLTYKYSDDNDKEPLKFSATNAGAYVQNFKINGANISGNIKGAYLTDNRNLTVQNLTTDFRYTENEIKFLDTSLTTTNHSKINGDLVFFSRDKSYSDFLNKIKIKATLKKSKLSVYDLKKFDDNLSGDDMFYFSTKITGTLNNISFNDLKMKSKNSIKANGNIILVNSFSGTNNFKLDGEFSHISTNIEEIHKLLPKVVDIKIKEKLAKLGDFNLTGIIKLRPQYLDANIDLKTKLGGTISDLHLTNITDLKKAKYEGTVKLKDFDLGKLIGNPNFGKITMTGEVDGNGLSPKKLTSALKVKIEKLEIKGYTCKNIDVDGKLDNRKFDGLLSVDDENIIFDFKGLADFSSKVNKFNFNLNIDKLDLKKTNLFELDSISEMKGNIAMDLEGNTIDDIVGKAVFNNFRYVNNQRSYNFKKFEFNSKIKDSIRTITFDSDKIINGYIKGKFLFKELIPLTKNALFSTYSNYEPVLVAPNQFIEFDFKIDGKIVDVLFHDINIEKDAHIRGNINANNNSVFIDAKSPKITAYDVAIDSLSLKIDNTAKQHTIIRSTKIDTKHYKIKNIELLSKTKNDTLYFYTEFKGGKKNTEQYNLNFFHTLDKEKRSVLGFKKSYLSMQTGNWLVNPNNDTINKISYNYDAKSFKFHPFLLTSGNQKVKFNGEISNKTTKINADFKDIDLQKTLPNIEDLKLEGILNGNINIDDIQRNISNANFEIRDLIVNNVSQGVLKAKVESINSFKKYNIDLFIRDYKFDNLKTTGYLDFTKENPFIDLKIKIDRYELDAFSTIGGDVISNIRGLVSGEFRAKGNLNNPDFEGDLQFNKTGLSFPYLNIDFGIQENSNITLHQQSFYFDNIIMTDSKKGTVGILDGDIKHIGFSDWYLDLNIESDNLLILDTNESEEEAYYGTAFLDGSAEIKGKTSKININLKGKTEKNTTFTIPLKEVTIADNYKLIKFIERKDTTSKKKIKEIKESNSGLSLRIDLEITNDAKAKVVIDKVNKNELEGRGNGDLSIVITPDGNFKMNGDLKIETGIYNFRYTGIPKKFEIEEGSTISWNGDPFKAELNITALYKARANPAHLLDNVVSSRKIPVNLYTTITGEIFDSKQEFEIKIPSADSSIASALEFKFTNDANSKMLNFFTLLLGNTFYDNEANGSFASTVATNTAWDVASNMVSEAINSKNSRLKVNFGYTQANKTKIDELIYDDQVDLSFQGVVSDRIVVNGKVGVPTGNSNLQSNIIGEGNIEILLNKSGSLRWRAFNKPNDIKYSLDEEGFTQGTSISYQIEFATFSEFINKILNKEGEKKEKRKKEKLKAITSRKKEEKNEKGKK